MSFDYSRAYVVSDDGIVIENGVHLIGGSPSPVGIISPSFPTRYFRDNGEIWFHTGSGSWNQISGSASFDVDLILADNFFDVLVDNEGNVLTGV